MVLASVYTSSTLGTPLSNPVTADANGVFPQIFAVEGTVLDLILKTAGGVTLYTQDDVVASGASSGTITRDFTNSRLRIAGSGGIISIEAGDPTGDDTGGQLRVGGYSGTQADSISLDAAAIDTTGKFKENSKKLPGVVYTAATTFTAASTVDIALPNDPVGCVAWDVEVWDFTMSTSGANLLARLSFDAGATYLAGASDYDFFKVAANDGDSTWDFAVSGGATAIRVLAAMEGIANKPGRISFRVMTPRSGSNVTTVEGRARGIRTATTIKIMTEFMGEGPASAGPCDHIRLLPDAGTITGKYRVMPLRGFGEV